MTAPTPAPPTAPARHLGHIVRLRNAMVTFLAEWPNIGVTGAFLRAVAWWWAGWPILVTVGLAAYAYVVASHWQLTALIVGFGLALDLIPNSLAALIPRRWQVLGAWAPRLFVVGIAIYAAVRIGWPWIFAGAVVTVVLVGIEVYLARVWPAYDMWRLWAQFRRRVPASWTVMAGKTQQIQAAGVGGEVTIARGLRTRPFLDHPAFNYVPRFDTGNYRVTARTYSPPGRNMAEYNKVVDELASDDPFVAFIQLPQFSIFDTHTSIVIDFHRPGPARSAAARQARAAARRDRAIRRLPGNRGGPTING